MVAKRQCQANDVKRHIVYLKVIHYALMSGQQVPLTLLN